MNIKKPKIKFKTIHTGHQFIDVEGVSSLMTCNAYSEMIDALIQARSELLHVYNILEIDGENTFNVKNINKALKNAGVQL